MSNRQPRTIESANRIRRTETRLYALGHTKTNNEPSKNEKRATGLLRARVREGK